MLNLEDLHLSIVAHEATHVALAHAAHIERSRAGAKKWLLDHPEWGAEMVGNLTALVWYLIIKDCESDDGDE